MSNNETHNALDILMSSLKHVEDSLNVKLPEMEHAIQALTSIMTDLDARVNSQESLIGLLLSESPAYQKYLKSQDNDNNSSPINGNKTRGKIVF